MKDPAVLFYTKDFLTGTAFFTDAERGQYIRLLCEQHQNGHIPENHMLSICFSLASPVVKKFVKDENGLYYNERLDQEILKRQKFIETRVVNGKKGGRPREEKKPSDLPSGEPLGLASQNLIGNGNGNIELGGTGERDLKVKNFTPPTLEEVKAYCIERKNGVDWNKWINHYQSKGWMIGKSKMKDWKAAVRTWENTTVETIPTKEQKTNSPSSKILN